MEDRRLVGIDLGITSAHTVRVLSGEGSLVCRGRAIPTVDSLEQVERAALAGTPAGTRLEVVVEPTRPAWLPIAVFFTQRGHIVYRVSSAKAMTCGGCCRAMPSPTASMPTPWPASHRSTRPGCTRAAAGRGGGGAGPPRAGLRPAHPSGCHPQAPHQGPGPSAAASQPPDR